MIRFLLPFLFMVFLYSCSTNDSGNTGTNTDSITTAKKLIPATCDTNESTPFWIIAVNAHPTADSASAEAEKLLAAGKEAGYLWIPDYKTLSGKQLFCVFIGPFSNDFAAVKYLSEYKKENSGAYAVKVDHEGPRMAIYSSFDIRKDDKKMNLVLTYARPAAAKAYFEDGGEDWGWFTSDVGQYINANLDNVYYGSLYESWYSPEEIAKIEKEMNLSDAFGYIMIKGNEKSFADHNTPDGVIQNICDFFGYEYKPVTGE